MSNRERGPYQIISAEMKAKIGCYAIEKGNTNAVRHFSGEYSLAESTVCDFKTKYLKELKIQGNPDRVTSLTHSNRGRPSLVGSVLDDKVADYLRDLRTQGCPVNRTIASAAV